MGGKKYSFRNWLLYCFFLCTLVLMVCGSAIGQEEFSLEEIVVTGSRIARNNNESVSPMVTVDAKLLDHSSTMAIETQLNKLPQFTPTIDVPTIAGMDIQANARNTPGEATVALRGIGANRTLVLINGRRGTPSNALGVIDINTIPTAAIEYVEAISGGASSTYGADAMAGVLNFIMKDEFEGFEINVQSGITQEWDNFEYQVSGIMGSNTSDGRGNISVALSYNERKDAFQRDRSWYKKNMANPSMGGSQYFPWQSGIHTEYSNLPDPDVVNAVMGLPEGQGFTNMAGVDIFDDGRGNAFAGLGLFGDSGLPGVNADGIDLIDNFNIKKTNNGLLSPNNIHNYLVLPMERYNMFARGNYEIQDWIGVFAQGYFSKVTTLGHQEPAPVASGWAAMVDPTQSREVIPPEILAILDSRPDPDAPFKSAFTLPFLRRAKTDVLTYNMIAGIEGTIPNIGWTYEIFGSQGEAVTTSLMTGFASLQRVREVLNGGPNFGQGFVGRGNLEQGYFGASTGTCTSGLNFFDWSSVSQDCFDAINADIKTKMSMKQLIWEANTQGIITELPMGDLRGALGASYRENTYEFLNDTLLSQGTSFLEQAVGLYPAGDSIGKIEAKEVYAELLVPILSDLPFAKQVEVNLGGRRSDYNTTGASYTYKAAIDWKATNSLRFRGGYNRAERTPNVGELFLAPEQTFGFFAGDVCSVENYMAWSANPNTNPEHWQDVVALCGQLMRASGNPGADRSYYGVDYEQVIANVDSVTTYQIPGGTTGFPSIIGNPNLKPEKADTWTIGFVLDSFIDTIPALMDWRVSVDYYMIEIKDAIGEQTADLAQRQCVDPAFNPTFDINSPYCAGFGRNQNGEIGDIKRSFFNSGRFETSGIDVSISWGMDAGKGHLSVSSLINYLISKKSSELTIFPLVDYAGSAGTSQNGLSGAAYEWRALTDVNYSINDLTLGIRWQHLDKIKSAGYPLGDRSLTGSPSYDLFDLLGSYNVAENFVLRFGVENMFNKKPPLTNINPNATNGMYGGYFDAQNNDVIGRRFYAGAKVFF